ncbi:hypothetical protein QBC40DRAFT_270811 [Triangularia verruculosa]|uniref:Uncharacterized protein n=1 Tax=Triangularia verruculosa TaxID=2587418 RepID=A0AAN6XSH3_9PEZI|nr:hypothetical protein QBC40DRAFT_270811 [Triangularia verruculosa]
MLSRTIDLSPHAIRLFEESFHSRESSKNTPIRQPLAGSPLKNWTPAPQISIQQPLEEPTTTATPADVGSAVTSTSEKVPGSTQTDGSFRFRKTRQRQRNLPLRKSSRLSGVVHREESTAEQQDQQDENLSEVPMAEKQPVDPMQVDQDTPPAAAPSLSTDEAVINAPEPQHHIVAQEQIELQSQREEPEQCTSSQTTSSQIDGVTLVPPSSMEGVCEDVGVGSFPYERYGSPQDVSANVGFPKRLLWPKPDVNATRQSSALASPLDSAPVPTLFKAREPAVPEPHQIAVMEQPVAEIIDTASAGISTDETNDADMLKCCPVDIEETEETEETEEVTVANMVLKPEPEEPQELDAQPPTQPIKLASAMVEPPAPSPQILEPEVFELQVLEPAAPAIKPAPYPVPAPQSELVPAPAPAPIPEPKTTTAPSSSTPAVSSFMAEIAQRASQGLMAIRRVLEQGPEPSRDTDNFAVSDTAQATDAEKMIIVEKLAAAPDATLDDETASLPSPDLLTSQTVPDHLPVDGTSEQVLDEALSPAKVANEPPAKRDTASEAAEMDVDTEDPTDPEKLNEVAEAALQTETSSSLPQRSPSSAPIEQSPWGVDTVSFPLGVNNDTPVPSRVAVLSAPDSCQQPATQSPWAKGDSQLQVVIPPAPEIRSFVPFSSPANSAVLQRPETPPPQINLPDGNNSQASIAQLSTPESNKSVQRTPESNNFGLSTKSFRDFMTPSPKPAKRRKISSMFSSNRNSAGPISSTQLLFDAATANPWTPGLLSSGSRSLRPTPATAKPKFLLRQSLSSSTPLNPRKRKHVTFAPLPGEISPLPASSPALSPNPDPSSPYFSAEYPSTAPTATITVAAPITSVPTVSRIRPSSPPPSSISADLPTASTEKFAKHFAKVATKRLGHTTFENPVAKLRQKKSLLPSASQQVCDSPSVEAMAEAFVFADAHARNSSSPTPAPTLPDEQDDDEALMQSQLDSQLGIVIEDGEEHVYSGETIEGETQPESQDHVSDVLLNLDDFLGVGGGLWDVDTAVRDMVRDQRREEEEKRRQEQEEMMRLEMGLGGSVWE